jgi:hypothetical protein
MAATHVEMSTDDALLAAYAATRDGEAFRPLLERYLPLVHSAARRQLAGDTAAADDVSQAVFILLADRAARAAGHAARVAAARHAPRRRAVGANRPPPRRLRTACRRQQQGDSRDRPRRPNHG